MASIRLARGLWRGCSRNPVPHLSTAEIARMRNELFVKEKERQLSLYPRIEKIEVKYVDKSHPGTVFIMNKGLSTPYTCAMHLSEQQCRKSVLALVDGKLWGMNRPFTQSCEIQFLNFKDEDPKEVNKAYWRSCALILGSVLEKAFKDEYLVTLVRAPKVSVLSGAFCYDVILDNRLNDWKPTEENLRSFTKDVHQLIHKDLPFEMLDVDVKVALEIFQHNPYKLDAIKQKASQHSEGMVQLIRLGDYVDISEGPHIPRTSFCGQYEVTAAHNLENSQSGLIRRVQGLSLPVELKLHHAVWYRLLERSQKLVTENRRTDVKDQNEVSKTESV
ncbi:large ribosomal subunit protein mL39 isoform X2 [Paroedura picta]|uniref:large ribosomal subunit protein mL39 isoform X2 n=1 Tax=Paroedura picta TaxID=143630 RepID=UPI0040560C53